MLKKILKLFVAIFVATQIQSGLHADGGGILPYHIDKNGQINILIAQEGAGKDKGEWGDFGGRGPANLKTSAMEGHEETMGVFTGTYKAPHKEAKTGIQKLSNKINLKGTPYTWSTSKGFNYQGYLLDVTQEVDNQGGRRKTIQHLERTLSSLENRKVPHEYTEKSDFTWIPLKSFVSILTGGKLNLPITISGKNCYPKKPHRITLRNPFVFSANANVQIFRNLLQKLGTPSVFKKKKQSTFFVPFEEEEDEYDDDEPYFVASKPKLQKPSGTTTFNVNGVTISVVLLGDITKQNVDAIVNAANVKLKWGTGISGAIRKAVGRNLSTEINNILKKKANYPTAKKGKGVQVGSAHVTSSGNLSRRGINYIIHAASPCFTRGHSLQKKSSFNNGKPLSETYQNVLREAEKHKNITSAALPFLSSGIFRDQHSKDKLASVAVNAVVDYLKSKKRNLTEVRFVLFGQSDLNLFLNLFKNKLGKAVVKPTPSFTQIKKPKITKPVVVKQKKKSYSAKRPVFKKKPTVKKKVRRTYKPKRRTYKPKTRTNQKKKLPIRYGRRGKKKTTNKKPDFLRKRALANKNRFGKGSTLRRKQKQKVQNSPSDDSSDSDDSDSDFFDVKPKQKPSEKQFFTSFPILEESDSDEDEESDEEPWEFKKRPLPFEVEQPVFNEFPSYTKKKKKTFKKKSLLHEQLKILKNITDAQGTIQQLIRFGSNQVAYDMLVENYNEILRAHGGMENHRSTIKSATKKGGNWLTDRLKKIFLHIGNIIADIVKNKKELAKTNIQEAKRLRKNIKPIGVINREFLQALDNTLNSLEKTLNKN